MKSLEMYLLEELDKNHIGHVIRARVNADGHVCFYIHAEGVASDTVDFHVKGNSLAPDPCVKRAVNG